MLMAHGFLRRIFEVFDRYETPVDMVGDHRGERLADDRQHGAARGDCGELQEFAEVHVEAGPGDRLPGGREHSATRRELRAASFRRSMAVNVRMISQGASLLNLSFVVARADLARAVELLHAEFFTELDPGVFEVGMKLAIVGYGKMGKLIEQLAPEYGFEVVLRLDEFNNANGAGMTRENFAGVDVAIEFSTPEAAVGEHRDAGGAGREHGGRHHGLVGRVGSRATRGRGEGGHAGLEPEFLDRRERVLRAWWRRRRGCWRMQEPTTPGPGRFITRQEGRASGTLLKLVDADEEGGYTRARSTSSSNRAGAHPGTHEIGFDSAADTITLRHTARSREGFARGALKAAQWVVGKTGRLRIWRSVLFW